MEFYSIRNFFESRVQDCPTGEDTFYLRSNERTVSQFFFFFFLSKNRNTDGLSSGGLKERVEQVN